MKNLRVLILLLSLTGCVSYPYGGYYSASYYGSYPRYYGGYPLYQYGYWNGGGSYWRGGPYWRGEHRGHHGGPHRGHHGGGHRR